MRNVKKFAFWSNIGIAVKFTAIFAVFWKNIIYISGYFALITAAGSGLLLKQKKLATLQQFLY